MAIKELPGVNERFVGDGVLIHNAHKNRQPDQSGVNYNPHKAMQQIVYEYEEDGTTLKSTTKLTPDKIEEMTKHKEVITQQKDGKITQYRRTVVGEALNYDEVTSVAPLNEKLANVATLAQPEEASVPRIRMAGLERAELPPSPPREIRVDPEFVPLSPAGGYHKAQISVMIQGPFGKFTIGCQEAFVYDIYLVLVHALGNGGLYEPPNDPQIVQRLVIGDQVHTGRCMAHYKMPDGKSAHSVYLLSE